MLIAEEDGTRGDEPQEQDRQAISASSDIKKAKLVIAQTLADAKLVRASRDSSTVAEPDKQVVEESLGATLVQGSAVKSSLTEINRIIAAKTSASPFINASDWRPTGRDFHKAWYVAQEETYSTGKTCVETQLNHWSNGSPLAGFNTSLEKVATGLHYAILVGDFLNQSTAATWRIVSEMGDSAPEGLRELAASSSRAALNAFSQSFLASANLDLHRREVALGNTRLNQIAKSALRTSPIGGDKVFDPTTAQTIFTDPLHAYALKKDNPTRAPRPAPFRGERSEQRGQSARQAPNKSANNNNNNRRFRNGGDKKKKNRPAAGHQGGQQPSKAASQ